MKNIIPAAASLMMAGVLCGGGEISTFHAYIDSDLCARLMLGPITDSRVQCTQKTFKEGSNLVVVRLKDNTVLSVNKEKMLKEHAGKLAEVSGETKLKAGTVKLESVQPVEADAIPTGRPGPETAGYPNLQSRRSQDCRKGPA